jgi:nucleoside-diphosphate kinase
MIFASLAGATASQLRSSHAATPSQSVHGSDSDENAAIEIAFFFKPEESVG